MTNQLFGKYVNLFGNMKILPMIAWGSISPERVSIRQAFIVKKKSGPKMLKSLRRQQSKCNSKLGKMERMPKDMKVINIIHAKNNCYYLSCSHPHPPVLSSFFKNFNQMAIEAFVHTKSEGGRRIQNMTVDQWVIIISA